MRRFLSAVAIFALFVTACGGGTPDSGVAASGGGGGGGGAGDLPAASNVFFGASFDPATLALIGKTGTVKAGTPVVAVGRVFTPRPPAETVVTVVSGSNRKPPRPVTASNSPDNADIFAFDLTPDALTPGTWVVSFTTPTGRIIASGFLTVTP